MKTKESSRFYIYIMAGLYLLYINYSLVKDIQEQSNKNKIIILVMVVFFALAALGMLINAIKGLKDINEKYSNKK